MVDSFNPHSVWKPFGAFSMGVILGEGQIVFLKGQVALDRDGRVVGKGDMAAQTRKTLENIQNVLAAVGGVMGDIFCLTHFVTDIEQFMKTGDIRREFFGEPFPVTTTVQVVCLYDPDLLVEITAMAEIPRELNYENNILLCDSALTTKMRRRQDDYLAQSHEVTAEMVAHWPITRRLWNNAIAMLGPVL